METKVCVASRVMGNDIFVRADFDIMVTEMAHEEWKRIVAAIFSRLGGASGFG